MILNLWKKKPPKPPIIHTLIQCQIQFVDADGTFHKGKTLKYFDPNTVICDMKEWVSIGIIEDGYIIDKESNEAYPITRIKKYWLETLETINVYPIREEFGFWKMWYNNEEVKERRVEELNVSNLYSN